MKTIIRLPIAAIALLAGSAGSWLNGQTAPLITRMAPGQPGPGPRSPQYAQVQQSLARGWNTWDTHSVTTQVLLPEGLAIHVGLKHNSTEWGDAFLGDALIGRLEKGAEVVTPGAHSWDGSYTDLSIAWHEHKWRIQSAHDGNDLVMLVSPLPSDTKAALPPTVVFSVNYLWNRPGAVMRREGVIDAGSHTGAC